jgi:hypothetical protein
MLTLELRVEDVLVPMMAQVEKDAPVENRSKPLPKDGDTLLLVRTVLPSKVSLVSSFC